MSNLIVVGISDLKIANTPDVLITYALGSCVGTCLYDSLLHIGGLSHILLPDGSALNDGNIMKYADTAIKALVAQLEKSGSSRSRLTAKIAGGANMFPTSSPSIGERNVARVKEELRRLNIRIVGEDTGLNYGRTVEFHPENGSVVVKSVMHGVSTL